MWSYTLKSIVVLSAFLMVTKAEADNHNGPSNHHATERSQPDCNPASSEYSHEACEIWPDAKFGEYGYEHGRLHRFGTIDDLMGKTNSNCCDGGAGGECRVTELWQNSDGKWFFNHNGIACPVTKSIQFDVKMPLDVNGVICAPAAGSSDCPHTTYCAAARPMG